MPKIYIAGSMSGHDDLNFPAFFKWEDQWIMNEWEVGNPARMDVEEFGSLEATLQRSIDDRDALVRNCLGRDLKWIADNADAIFMMKGWEKSVGAMAEWTLAKALGLQIIYE